MLVWSARVRRPPVDGIRVRFPLVERNAAGTVERPNQHPLLSLHSCSNPLPHRIARLPTARLTDWTVLVPLLLWWGRSMSISYFGLLCLRREECNLSPMYTTYQALADGKPSRHCFRCCHVRRSPHGPRSRTAPLVAILADDVKLTKLKPRTTSRTPTTHACIVLVATSVSPTRHWRWRELGERGRRGTRVRLTMLETGNIPHFYRDGR